MHARIHFRSFLAGLTIALGGLLSPNQAATNPVALAATSYVVNDGNADCGSFVATYASMQTAVSNAIADNVSTILVCPGSYNSFFILNAKKLTIKAAIPATYPIINAPANANGYIVIALNSSGVVLDGLKFDGSNFDDTLTNVTYGIYFHNASGTVQNSSVTRVRCFPSGCSYGHGISLVDDNDDGKVSSLAVKNTNVTDVGSSAISASGPTKLTVSGVRLTGDFSGGVDAVGVAFHHSEAAGSVTKSIISNVRYGVYIDGASKVTVSGNTIEDADYGAFITNCNLGSEPSSSNKITGNMFSDIAIYGITINNGGASCGNTDKNTISGNGISGAMSSLGGIRFTVQTGAFADKNKVSGNTIYGFDIDFITDPDATNTSISKNTWLP